MICLNAHFCQTFNAVRPKEQRAKGNIRKSRKHKNMRCPYLPELFIKDVDVHDKPIYIKMLV